MRRTKEQAKETRHAILQAACELFTEGDFSQITLNQIAERAGLTKGAIYWHFKIKRHPAPYHKGAVPDRRTRVF